MDNQSQEPSVLTARPAHERCAHPTVLLYVTHGRFAPPQRYWSCQECGASFAPETQATATASAQLNNGTVGSSVQHLQDQDLRLLREIHAHLDGIQDGSEDASYGDRMANKFADRLGELIKKLGG